MEPSKTQNPNVSSSNVGVPTPSISRDAKELASDAVDRAKDLAGERVSEQRERSASEIGKIASALHHTSEEVGSSFAAPYIEKAAGMLDRLSGSVRDGSLRDAVRSTERFARREPLLFLGGAFVLELFASHFLKSSARAESEDEDENFGIRGEEYGTRYRRP